MTPHPARHDLVEALRAFFEVYDLPALVSLTDRRFDAPIDKMRSAFRAALASEAASQVPADGWWKERLPRAGESWEEAAFRLHASPGYGGSLEDARCAVYDAADRDRAAPDQEGPADGK